MSSAARPTMFLVVKTRYTGSGGVFNSCRYYNYTRYNPLVTGSINE